MVGQPKKKLRKKPPLVRPSCIQFNRVLPCLIDINRPRGYQIQLKPKCMAMGWHCTVVVVRLQTKNTFLHFSCRNSRFSLSSIFFQYQNLLKQDQRTLWSLSASRPKRKYNIQDIKSEIFVREQRIHHLLQSGLSSGREGLR